MGGSHEKFKQILLIILKKNRTLQPKDHFGKDGYEKEFINANLEFWKIW